MFREPDVCGVLVAHRLRAAIEAEKIQGDETFREEAARGDWRFTVEHADLWWLPLKVGVEVRLAGEAWTVYLAADGELGEFKTRAAAPTIECQPTAA